MKKTAQRSGYASIPMRRSHRLGMRFVTSIDGPHSLAPIRSESVSCPVERIGPVRISNGLLVCIVP